MRPALPVGTAVLQIMRRRRAERGALQLASPEVKFTIDTQTQDPLEVGMYQVRGLGVMRGAQGVRPGSLAPSLPSSSSASPMSDGHV